MLTRRRLALASAIFLVLPLAACAARSRQPIPKDVIAARIDDMARAFLVRNAPVSMSVVVSRRNEVVFERAYGMADIATKRPATTATVYRLVGPSMQFTATLVLKQIERGRLAITDPIGRYLTTGLRPEWRLITIEQLLSHTSGLPGSYKRDTPPEEAASAATLIAWAARDTLRFEPGARFGFSRVGYLLLGALVEKLYGKPYDAALREEIARPLGLPTLGLCTESGLDEARGYEAFPTGDRKPIFNGHSSKFLGESGVCASAGDLAAFNRALHGGRVLSPTSYTTMTNSIKGAERPAIAECCLMVQNSSRGGKSFFTVDFGEGFYTENAWFTAQSVSVTVLYNSFGAGIGRRFALDIADALSKPAP